ncbi:MAG: patatin-like phospholipase family protein [Oceanococcus sp.]
MSKKLNLLAQNLRGRYSLFEAQRAMAHAESYEEWLHAAKDYEQYSGGHAWREDEASPDYDNNLVRDRLNTVRRLRYQDRPEDLMFELRQGLHWNLGNSGNPLLYGVSPLGTKYLIESYLDTVTESLEWIAQQDTKRISKASKRRFFSDLAQSYGRSALMLSGGATMGLFHVGVVRSLYTQDLLPDVMSGASAGSLVGSSIAGRTREEAEHLMNPDNLYLDLWGLLSPKDIRRTGGIMDQNKLRRGLAHNVPNVTFEEAFALSGIAMNITVTPVAANQPARLLNHLTFPHLYQREAVLASCAVPLLFPPVKLATQNLQGKREPYMPSLRWADGSLLSDLPRMRLRRLFNVNHFIVSQTNPHVLPFISSREPDESGLLHGGRRFMLSTTRHQARNVLKLARNNLPKPLTSARRHLDYAVGILDQDYRGNVTILPEFDPSSYARLIRNPRPQDVRRMILQGERATWPKLAMIRQQTAISRALKACLESLDEVKLGRSAA